jgi:hypothetical protein
MSLCCFNNAVFHGFTLVLIYFYNENIYYFVKKVNYRFKECCHALNISSAQFPRQAQSLYIENAPKMAILSEFHGIRGLKGLVLTRKNFLGLSHVTLVLN